MVFKGFFIDCYFAHFLHFLAGVSMSFIRCLLLITTGVLSCASLAYTPISESRRAELFAQFRYEPQIQITQLKKATGCRAQEVQYDTSYPERETPYTVKARLYLPAKENIPLVLMLPPIGGSNVLDTDLAQTLCRSGMAALLLLNDFGQIESSQLVPVEDHNHTVRRVVAALKGGILLAQAEIPAVNSERVGLFGASLGGILGSMAYGVLPELSAATFLVNGGDVPHILAFSTERRIARIRRARMAEQGLKTNADYEAYLNRHLIFDPLHFVPFIPPETVKLYLSKSDDLVPTQDQMLLYEALGSPQGTVFYNVNHYLSIFSALGVASERQNIADWFLQRFSLENPRVQLSNFHTDTEKLQTP